MKALHSLAIIENSKQIAETFSDVFSNAVKRLCIKSDIFTHRIKLNELNAIRDPVLKATKKYEIHPSILKVKDYFALWNEFQFYTYHYRCGRSEITHLNIATAYPKDSVPSNTIEEFCDIFC